MIVFARSFLNFFRSLECLQNQTIVEESKYSNIRQSFVLNASGKYVVERSPKDRTSGAL